MKHKKYIVYSNLANNGNGGWIYHEPKMICESELEEVYENLRCNSLSSYDVFDTLEEAYAFRDDMCYEEVEICGHFYGDYDYYGERGFRDKLYDILEDKIIEEYWNVPDGYWDSLPTPKKNPLTNMRVRDYQKIIEKNNRLIAEFMNVDHVDIDTWLENNSELKYHESWDWLMPVVETAYHNGAEGNQIGDITHALVDCDREKTYIAVVEFIKYYNNLNQIK